jgi:hypothetical protein
MNPNDRRMKEITHAIGYKEIEEQLLIFMEKNNFDYVQMNCVFHVLNSGYFMGKEPVTMKDG